MGVFFIFNVNMFGSFMYKGKDLFCEKINLNCFEDNILEEHPSPCFVYSKGQLLNNITKYKDAFEYSNHLVGYSVKANFNPHLLKIIKDQGLNAVTVSGFEILLALRTGFTGDKIFFNRVGKQEWEVKIR